LNDRSVIAQGIINPTMINIEDRYNSQINNFSSWFFRPNFNSVKTISSADPTINNSFLEYRHYYSIPGYKTMEPFTVTTGEIPNNSEIQLNTGYPNTLHASS
jgi:hypothetical protein